MGSVPEPRQEPGTEGGTKVQWNIKDILTEIDFMRRHIDELDHFFKKWSRDAEFESWHAITRGISEIERRARDARDRIYNRDDERPRRGDTGPLSRSNYR